MKKSDLKAGDIVLISRGEIGIILDRGELVVYSSDQIKRGVMGGITSIKEFKNDLKYDYHDDALSQYDIDAVLSCDYMNQYLSKFTTGELTVDDIKWTWERYPKRRITLEGEEFMVSEEEFEELKERFGRK